MSPRSAIALALVLPISFSALGQSLVTSWAAPSTDDGNPIPNFTASWITDPATGQTIDAPTLPASQALAADNANDRLFASSGTSISSYRIDASGVVVQLTAPGLVRDQNGKDARPGQIVSLGFANGDLIASVVQSLGDQQRNRGLVTGLYRIDPTTRIATLISAAQGIPVLPGMDFNADDGFMYGVTGASGAQTIVRFNLTSFVLEQVAAVPASAYNGGGFAFDGLAVGGGNVFLTVGLNSGYGGTFMPVFDLGAGVFGTPLQRPIHRAENSRYGGAATYYIGSANNCPCDVDGDGEVGVSDISLVLLGFGDAEPNRELDLDQDNQVGSSDLSWMLLNFGPCG